MTARTALDPRDRLTRTAEKLKGHPWAQGMDLWLDGFTDFTPQQREVLRPLLRQADSLTVTPHLRPSGGRTRGRWDLLSRTPHGGPSAPPGGTGGNIL